MSATEQTPERAALEKCVGALQFLLAFYEPHQRHLDTEAWKVACAGAVAAYLEGAAVIDWDAIPYRADNGSISREAKARRP
jgi:hypothetical protein